MEGTEHFAHMTKFKPYTLNIGSSLLEISRPQVMGILNATPDSFFEGSRCNTNDLIRQRVEQLLSEGADMIDVGGYSSRPMADDISPDEEYARLANALEILRGIAPEAVVSVDTFRAGVARRCVENLGVQIVNDISAGELDRDMLATVAELKVPYIMMHMRGNPHTMMQLTDYDNLTADILKYFSEKIKAAELAGITDIIVDPGFGFSKTLEQNYRLMAELNVFHTLEMPLLVGISRKSMIYKLLNTTPAESLNGTTALNTMALLQGASILRVHDVKEAVETVKIVNKLQDYQEQQYGIND